MKNTKIDCLNFDFTDYPKLKKNMFVELWNGEKGHIDTVVGENFYLYQNSNFIHIMNVKFIECNLKDLV
jgi:hypothetical protein